MASSSKTKNRHVAPECLNALINAHFFLLCSSHQQDTNYFCLHCMGYPPLCPSCLDSHPKSHFLVQIRRCSYHSVVRVSEIQKAVNLSKIQKYNINGGQVVFINKRAQLQQLPDLEQQGKGVTNNCRICKYNLHNGFHFCSLACKQHDIINRLQEATTFLEPEHRHNNISNNNSSNNNSSSRSRLFGSYVDISLATTLSTLTNQRRFHRRKGVPRRAPMV